jgi:hypothetical protein
LTTILAFVLGKDVLLLPGAFARMGRATDPRTVLKGSTSLQFVGCLAGIIAVVLSVLVPLIFHG